MACSNMESVKRQRDMAFVNEFVSGADIEKYELEALHKEWWGEIPPRFRYMWTVDRVMDAHYIRMQAGGGKEELNRIRGVLFFRGVHWDVALRHEPGCSLSFDDKPYRIIYGLVHIKHPEVGAVPREEIIPVLKDALTVYGMRGIYHQVPNTTVTFTF
jgi:hypothetical protein